MLRVFDTVRAFTPVKLAIRRHGRWHDAERHGDKQHVIASASAAAAA